MRTSFTCPTCRAPLIVRFVAAAASGPPIDVAALGPKAVFCPNPFCRTELPARHDKAALVYALVGSAAEVELMAVAERES